MKNNSNKGFIVQGIIALVALVLIIGGAYYAGTKKATAPESEWKTYKDDKSGIEFNYPSKLKLSVSDERINLSHSIPFENSDGGCDMIGNAELSKNLTDFDISFDIVMGEVKPPYVDGEYLAGNLKGNWAYQGAEGCGQTLYYFPIEGNRTLVITKQELQVLSPIVAAEVRNKVIAVPGVISYEESNEIIKKILSTLKFTSPEIQTSADLTPSITVISPNGGEILYSGAKEDVEYRINNPKPQKNYKVIFYLDGQDEIGTIYSNSSNSYNWRIGCYAGGDACPTLTGEHKIQARLYDGNKLLSQDESDDYFSTKLKFSQPISDTELVASITTDRKIYSQNEKIEINFNVYNPTNKDITLQFYSGCITSYKIGGYDQSLNRVCTANAPQIVIKSKSSYSSNFYHYPETYKIPTGKHKLSVFFDKYVGETELTITN